MILKKTTTSAVLVLSLSLGSLAVADSPLFTTTTSVEGECTTQGQGSTANCQSQGGAASATTIKKKKYTKHQRDLRAKRMKAKEEPPSLLQKLIDLVVTAEEVATYVK